jgi:hypothetical protein
VCRGRHSSNSRDIVLQEPESLCSATVQS